MTQPTKPPANKPAPLGRGLSALFGDADASYTPQKIQIARINPHEPPPPKGSVTKLSLTWLQPSALQPRRNFNEAALKELAESIRERGILEPLLVRPIKGHTELYEIIAGERRWRAAQIAGAHEAPVVVREMTDREALEIALIENIQRQDLTPLEEAEAYQRLLGEFNHSPEALAKIVGKSRPYIANLVRLLALPAEIKQMVDEGKLTAGHARALIGSFNPVYFAEQVVAKGLSVRQTEDLVKDRTEHPENFLKGKMGRDPDREALERELGRVTGLRVKIKGRGASGAITLHFKTLDQLDGLIKKLKG